MPIPINDKHQAVNLLVEQLNLDFLDSLLWIDCHIDTAELIQQYGTSEELLFSALEQLITLAVITKDSSQRYFINRDEKQLIDNALERCLQMESLALPSAIVNGNAHWEAAVIALQLQLVSISERLSAQHDIYVEEWISAHEQFYQLLMLPSDTFDSHSHRRLLRLSSCYLANKVRTDDKFKLNYINSITDFIKAMLDKNIKQCSDLHNGIYRT